MIIIGDVREKLKELPNNSVHCVVTSPPYWGLRDYGVGGQIGLEPTMQEYIAMMVEVFREVKRVLRDDGVCFLNLGDSYNGSGSTGSLNGIQGTNLGSHNKKQAMDSLLKHKDLCGIPWRVALALQDDGWWLRSEIIWCKKSPMPESVRDRPSSATEKIFMFTKSPKYFYDAEAVRVDNGNGSKRNLWNYWILGTKPFTGWTQTYRLEPVELDAVSDGMMHKVFPGCPVHGCVHYQDPTCLCGEHEVDGLNRTGHNETYHESEPFGDCVPIDHLSEQLTYPCKSDCLDQLYLTSAIDHNTQTHKMGHVPLTTQPYISCGETSCHIACKSIQLLIDEHISRNHGNSILEDYALNDLPLDPSERTLYRRINKHTLPIPPECFCSFYQVITKKSSHFATFPRKLVETCIKAGTSEWGCCPECGSPWMRVVEKIPTGKKIKTPMGWEIGPGSHGTIHSEGRQGVVAINEETVNQTIGFKPSCSCGHPDTIPCTVLDPFLGSGTTGLVAEAMGRSWIGIELKPEYAAMAEKRIGVNLFRQESVR